MLHLAKVENANLEPFFLWGQLKISLSHQKCLLFHNFHNFVLICSYMNAHVYILVHPKIKLDNETHRQLIMAFLRKNILNEHLHVCILWVEQWLGLRWWQWEGYLRLDWASSPHSLSLDELSGTLAIVAPSLRNPSKASSVFTSSSAAAAARVARPRLAGRSAGEAGGYPW